MKQTKVLRYIAQKTRRRLPALLLMTAANMGVALFGVLFALGTRGVIDAAIGGERSAFLRACLVQAGIIAAILLCQFLYRFLHDRLGAVLDRDWKQDLVHGLLRGDYAGVSRFHSGELLNRLNNDVRTVNNGLLATLPGVASLLTRLAAVVAVLAALEPVFTAAMAALGIIVVLTTGVARRKLRQLHKQVSASEGRVSGFLQECLEKLMLVQAMGVEQEVERRADGLLAERYSLQRKRRRVSLTANTCVSILSYASGFAALLWSAVGILQGRMTFGDLTAITQLVGQLQGPFVNMSSFIPQYIAMTAAAERLMELDQLAAADEPEGEAPNYGQVDAICAEGISFAYDRDQVLKNGSFSLPKGAFAVVTGPSGVGKSTILKLLLGIFPPNSGELYLKCGETTAKISKKTRKLFAYVPQGNLLFSGTLRENLTLTKPDATDAEIQQAIFVSCMDQFLPQLPQGLETILGENAHGLSEGQAQRLAIARAVLGGAPILLLDEVTSALDAPTEQLVLQRIRALPDRTCIAVTHRPAAQALTDWQILVGENEIRCEKQVGGRPVSI